MCARNKRALIAVSFHPVSFDMRETCAMVANIHKYHDGYIYLNDWVPWSAGTRKWSVAMLIYDRLKIALSGAWDMWRQIRVMVND